MLAVTTKKNSVIATSLTSPRASVCSSLTGPACTATGADQRASYAECQAELAQPRATAAATTITMPPAASTSANRWSGRTTRAGTKRSDPSHVVPADRGVPRSVTAPSSTTSTGTAQPPLARTDMDVR